MHKEMIKKFRKETGLDEYHLIGPDKERKIYLEDRKILWASMGRYTISTEEFPLVGTYGLGPCVAIAGRDSLNKISFISHNLPLKNLEKTNKLMFNELFKKGIEKENLEFYLISNDEKGISGKYAKEYLNLFTKKIQIIYEDLKYIKDPLRIGKSFILDSINSNFYAFPGFI
jgi:chemotaxis receptor (MCP) glutamine deamidase CheD